MIKVCAWFNIVVGFLVAGLALLAALFEAFVGVFMWGGWDPVFSMVCAVVVLAGLLFGFSGVFLFRSDSKVLGKAVLFQGLAVAIAVFVSIGIWVLNPVGPLLVMLSSPEDHLEFFIPAGFLLFALIEWSYVLVRWSKGQGNTL